MKFFTFLLSLILIVSCSIKPAPNYNTGRSHNEQNSKRLKEINKFDKRMKNAMIKHRAKYSRGFKNKHKSKNKNKRRFI